jgi:23S rRNA (guanosine2251-2'-O)-methyltransferase
MPVLYGINAVMETLRADPARVERVSIQRGLAGPRLQAIIDLARQAGTPLVFEDRAWLDRKAGGGRHQGVICHVSEAAMLSAEEVLRQASSPGLLLILDGVEDPQNLGATLRSAEVAGADGVFIPQRRSAGLSASAVKASAGAATHVKVARVSNTNQAIELIKSSGYWVTGLSGDAGKPIWEIDFLVSTALVVGSEGSGLHRLVSEKCDFLASIPLRGKVGSYNVSVAAGIALYEVLRQRSLFSAANKEK